MLLTWLGTPTTNSLPRTIQPRPLLGPLPGHARPLHNIADPRSSQRREQWSVQAVHARLSSRIARAFLPYVVSHRPAEQWHQIDVAGNSTPLSRLAADSGISPPSPVTGPLRWRVTSYSIPARVQPSHCGLHHHQTPPACSPAVAPHCLACLRPAFWSLSDGRGPLHQIRYRQPAALTSPPTRPPEQRHRRRRDQV
jgi:hypothetical protein